MVLLPQRPSHLYSKSRLHSFTRSAVRPSPLANRPRPLQRRGRLTPRPPRPTTAPATRLCPTPPASALLLSACTGAHLACQQSNAISVATFLLFSDVSSPPLLTTHLLPLTQDSPVCVDPSPMAGGRIQLPFSRPPLEQGLLTTPTHTGCPASGKERRVPTSSLEPPASLSLPHLPVATESVDHLLVRETSPPFSRTPLEQGFLTDTARRQVAKPKGSTRGSSKKAGSFRKAERTFVPPENCSHRRSIPRNPWVLPQDTPRGQTTDRIVFTPLGQLRAHFAEMQTCGSCVPTPCRARSGPHARDWHQIPTQPSQPTPRGGEGTKADTARTVRPRCRPGEVRRTRYSNSRQGTSSHLRTGERETLPSQMQSTHP